MEEEKSRRRWRAMLSKDLAQADAVANRVHPSYPEDDAVLAERQRLYPAGCYVLADGEQLFGYLLSHPWRYGHSPPLNTFLHAIPERPTTYYLHDIALLADVRQSGEGSCAVELVIAHALSRAYQSVSLVAVNRSTEFWLKHGFAIVTEPTLSEKLRSYGEGAHFMVRHLSLNQPRPRIALS